VNEIEQLRLHAEALETVIQQDQKWFGPVVQYAAQLKKILGGPPEKLTKDALVMLSKQCSDHIERWRPKPIGRGALYIPPPQFSNSAPTIDKIAALVKQITAFSDVVFQRLVEDSAPGPAAPSSAGDIKITREGVFFKGQTFDAMAQIVEIFKLATKSLDVIDGYADNTVLKLLTSKGNGVPVRLMVLPKAATPAFQALGATFKVQWGPLEIRSSAAFHDRFILVDSTEVYHLGASINHAGKKGFMFSRVEEPKIITAVLAEWNNEWVTATVVV